MFRKLRNHLVVINVTITTVVLVIAFATIYIVAKSSTDKRLIPRGDPEFSQREFKIMEDHMRDDRKESLDSLLASLLAVGLVVEVAVVLLSYYLAEIAIRPVREAYDAQKDFIANASHEFKTPLAAITANLEAADIQNNHWINNIRQEVQLLNGLNSELLQLAQADNMQNAPSKKSEVKVQDLFDELNMHFEPEMQAQKIRLKTNITPKNAVVMTQLTDLRQLLTILLDNAIKYGQKNITMNYCENDFWVTNDGATIPTEKLTQVFDRFYQVDKSAGGSGLGLAIAKSLAERNKWKLVLESHDKITIAKLTIK